MIIHDHVTAPPHGEKFVLAENQKILLMPVGDVHYLSEGWPLHKFVGHMKWGMDHGAWFLGMGEYLDPLSASQRFLTNMLRDSAKKELSEFITGAVEDFYRLIEFTKGRWIGLLEGDHRWDFADGTTADQLLCSYLGCKFLGDAALIRITYPELHPKKKPRVHAEADCLVYAHHGVGSSRLSGGHLHRVEDLTKFVEADIYLMGHSHAKTSAPIDRQVVTPDGVHYHRTKVVARTGTWQKSYVSKRPQALTTPAVESRATYAEKAAYIPAAMGGIALGIGYEPIDGSEYMRPTIHFSV